MTVFTHHLTLSGTDKRKNRACSNDVFKYPIEEIYLGYDGTFSRWETRGFEKWEPLRLSLSQEGINEKLYLICNFDRGTSSNRECFDFLKDWMSS